MKRAVMRVSSSAFALLVLLSIAAFSTHDSWAPGMLVAAPYPQGVPAQRPADVRASVSVTRRGATVRAWVFEPDGAPRGTVVLLHGIRDQKLHLVPDARRHAARGLRAVAVDSRGHGESSGRYLTYGVEEAQDLTALVDELERLGLLARPLAVVGNSYGAATALQYAAIDPRVDRVAALAPFASLRQVVRAYLGWMLGPPGRWMPGGVVDRLIDESAQRAGFDPDRACPRCVAPRIRARVLLVHSRDDERIPWRHSLEIHDALRSRKKLFLVTGVSHVRVGRGAGVREEVQRWLDAD